MKTKLKYKGKYRWRKLRIKQKLLFKLHLFVLCLAALGLCGLLAMSACTEQEAKPGAGTGETAGEATVAIGTREADASEAFSEPQESFTQEEGTQVTVSNETQDVTQAEETQSLPAEAATEAATELPVAGENSGLERDGTPKKYFTLSFDDGITQDIRLMEILRKYGVSCCTFNINTGLLGANWSWVGEQFQRPDVTHQRFTQRELRSDLYQGFDVEVHTLTHPSLKNLSDAQVRQEVYVDARNIQRYTGIVPVGMAWPGGDTEYNPHNIEVILRETGIRFARGTTATGTFALPEYFMTWYPTCSISDGNVMSLAQQFLDAPCTEDMLFYVWGHGYELDLFHTWDRFEELVKMMAAAAEDGQIVLVTNAEFYQLFKDQIPSWKS